MSQIAKTPKTTAYIPQDLDAIVELLRANFAGKGEVPLYKDLAARLSRLANQNHGKPWTWRYVQSVHHDTLGHAPSKRFAHAVSVLAATMDGTPAAIADSEPVTVYARRGAIQAGALIDAVSVPCDYPPCKFHYIKTHWNMHYCPVHRDPKSRR